MCAGHLTNLEMFGSHKILPRAVNFDLVVYYVFSIQLGQIFVGVSWGQADTHAAHETIHMFME